MTKRRDLRRALEDLGRRPVPVRSQAFVADLERRLLEMAGSDKPPAGGASGSDQVVSLDSRRRARLAPGASIAAKSYLWRLFQARMERPLR